MAYPIFLDISGKLCVVVGAGKVAERRVTGLIDAGALVRVVGIEASAGLVNLAKKGKLELWQQAFEPAVLDDCYLVVAATDDKVVNQRVQECANLQDILFCGADHTTQSDFTVPASIRRGDLHIGISTGGTSPAYAKLLRREMDAWLQDEHADFLDLLAELRPKVYAQHPNAPELRQQFWRELVTAENLALVRNGELAQIKERIDACLSS